MFRVIATTHPQIHITPLNAMPAVAQMIKWAIAERTAQARQRGGE